MTTSTKSVRGLGAAGRGTEHHIRQRVSAIALIFLVPWFLSSVAFAMTAGYSGAIGWMQQSHNALLFILLLSAALYHMRLGLQTVIEDYIGRAGTKQALLIGNVFIVGGIYVVTLLSVLKLWLGNAA
jgi:succinate dehydrogenase / fumarate reductase membrane anchor subunit